MSRYIENAELDNWFGYHPPSSPAIADGHDFVRRESRELAVMLNALLPEGAEKTLALRKIREASMWANAAIACKQEIGERPWLAQPVSITVTPVAVEPDMVTRMTGDAFLEAFTESLTALIMEAAGKTLGPLSDAMKDDFVEACNLALKAANDQLDAEERAPDVEAV